MANWNRRTVLATGATSTIGGLLAAVGAGESESDGDGATDGTDTDDERPDGESDDVGPADGEGAEADAEDGESTGDGPLDLSVDAPGSVPYEEIADPAEDAAEFSITVTNRGSAPVTVEIGFEIGPIDEPFVLELAPGECDTVYTGVMSRDLGVGDHEWTVTAADETETGTLTVTETAQC